MKGNDYVKGRTQAQNVKAVIADILGHGNEKCLLPGQPEARSGRAFQEARRPAVHQGGNRGIRIISPRKSAKPAWNLAEFKSVQVTRMILISRMIQLIKIRIVTKNYGNSTSRQIILQIRP